MRERETACSPLAGKDFSFAVDRRTVLGAAATIPAVVAAPALARTVLAGTSADAKRIDFVIADSRIGESRAFARLLERQGAEVLDVTHGLTALWQDRLVPHWQNSRAMVAGLTTRPVWDALSQQAGNQFRKPRVLGRHLADRQSGIIVHRLSPPEALAPRVDAATLATLGWPAEMARLAHVCGTIGQPCGNEVHFAGTADGLPLDQSLVSWIIA